MKKKIIAAMLAGAMVLSVTACGGGSDSGSNEAPSTDTAPAADTGSNEAEAPAPAASAGSVELVVTTTFAGEDTNAQNYKNAVAA